MARKKKENLLRQVLVSPYTLLALSGYFGLCLLQVHQGQAEFLGSMGNLVGSALMGVLGTGAWFFPLVTGYVAFVQIKGRKMSSLEQYRLAGLIFITSAIFGSSGMGGTIGNSGWGILESVLGRPVSLLLLLLVFAFCLSPREVKKWVSLTIGYLRSAFSGNAAQPSPSGDESKKDESKKDENKNNDLDSDEKPVGGSGQVSGDKLNGGEKGSEDISRPPEPVKELDQKDKPEPDYDATRHVQTRVNKACKNDGFNIIFTGFDGDTVVSHGYESIFYEVMRGNFFAAYKEYNKDRFRKKIDSRAIDFIWRFVIESYTPYFIKHLYKLAKRDLLQHHAAFFASEDVRETIKYENNKRIYNTNGRLLSHQSDIFNSRFWQHHFEMLDTDVAYMGLEYRHPFMNREFMSLCLNIPFKLRRSDGFNRFIMREAIKEYAPTEIVNRVTKSHVGEYYNYSYEKNFEEMKEQILNAPADINEYLDLDRIKNFNLKDPSTLRKNSFQHICTLVNWHNRNNFDKS